MSKQIIPTQRDVQDPHEGPCAGRDGDGQQVRQDLQLSVLSETDGVRLAVHSTSQVCILKDISKSIIILQKLNLSLYTVHLGLKNF